MTWAPVYSTAEAFKSEAGISSSASDESIDRALEAASRAVDATCFRQFGRLDEPVARTYGVRWSTSRCRWVARIDDLQDATGLVVLSDEDATEDYRLTPLNAPLDGRPWTALELTSTSSLTASPAARRPELTVTALWGWSSVPGPVVSATLLQAARFFKRRDAPFGIAGSPEMGSELRLLAAVDPDVAVLLGPFRRRWGAV